jgi:hypothetical protein
MEAGAWEWRRALGHALGSRMPHGMGLAGWAMVKEAQQVK